MHTIVCSDHFPLCVDIDCEFTPICSIFCKWHIARDDDKLEYSHRTNHLPSNKEHPTEYLLCRNANCTSHFYAIDCFIQVLYTLLKVQNLNAYTLPLVHLVRI